LALFLTTTLLAPTSSVYAYTHISTTCCTTNSPPEIQPNVKMRWF